MSEPCPNAKKNKRLHGGKVIGYTFTCQPLCELCRGRGEVDECPDCDGCGLRRGGTRCETCRCYGKVPAEPPRTRAYA